MISNAVDRIQHIANQSCDLFHRGHTISPQLNNARNETRPENHRPQDARGAGAPHPFVNQNAVGRYLTVVSECMDVQLARRAARADGLP